MDWGTVVPEQLDGINIIPPPKLPLLQPNYMAYWEVIMPKEPLWMSLWKHDLSEDIELWLWQCRLVETLDLVIDRRLKDEKMQTYMES